MKLGFALIAGLLGLALFHSGEFGSQFNQMMGDRIDVRFCSFINEHLFQALRGKAEWLSPAMFFPHKGTLGYSDVFLLHFLAYAPFRVFTDNPFSALQFSVIMLNLLTFVTTFLFLRRGLLTSTVAATLGAFFFSFNSAKFNQLNHIQLQPLLLLPLMTWLLWGFLKNLTNQSAREVFLRLSVAGLLLNIQLLTAVYVAWYYAFWILLFFVIWVTVKSEHRANFKLAALKHKIPLALATATFLIGLVPFLFIYVPVVLETGTRSYGEVKPMIPRWQSLFWMDSTNYVWGWLANSFPSFYQLPLHWEHRIGLGLITTLGIPATFIYSCFKYRTSNTFEKKIFMWPVILCGSVVAYYLWGMMYWSNHSPWWIVFKFIPGAASIRAVARYALVTALPIAIGLALLSDLAWQKTLRLAPRVSLGARALLATIVILILAEQFGRQLTFSKTEEFTKMTALSQQLEPSCDNFYITMKSKPPEYMAEVQGDALAVSMLTGKPTLNGYSGQSPKTWQLWDIGSQDYLKNVEDWRQANGVTGKSCALNVDLP